MRRQFGGHESLYVTWLSENMHAKENGIISKGVGERCMTVVLSASPLLCWGWVCSGVGRSIAVLGKEASCNGSRQSPCPSPAPPCTAGTLGGTAAPTVGTWGVVP